MPPDSFLLKPGQTWVMLGDSITEDPSGYSSICARVIAARYPDFGISIVNAGVSGNKACDMLSRFERDVLSHGPDWVSISAGVNDVWHGFYDFETNMPRPEFSEAHGSAIAVFNESIDKMLRILRDRGTNVLIVEPTVIGESPQSRENQTLREYVRFLKDSAELFEAHLCPLHELCWTTIAEGKRVDPNFTITRDGVHMNAVGAQMMADGVLRSLGILEPAPTNQ